MSAHRGAPNKTRQKPRVTRAQVNAVIRVAKLQSKYRHALYLAERLLDFDLPEGEDYFDLDTYESAHQFVTENLTELGEYRIYEDRTDH